MTRESVEATIRRPSTSSRRSVSKSSAIVAPKSSAIVISQLRGTKDVAQYTKYALRFQNNDKKNGEDHVILWRSSPRSFIRRRP